MVASLAGRSIWRQGPRGRRDSLAAIRRGRCSSSPWRAPHKPPTDHVRGARWHVFPCDGHFRSIAFEVHDVLTGHGACAFYRCRRGRCLTDSLTVTCRLRDCGSQRADSLADTAAGCISRGARGLTGGRSSLAATGTLGRRSRRERCREVEQRHRDRAPVIEGTHEGVAALFSQVDRRAASLTLQHLVGGVGEQFRGTAHHLDGCTPCGVLTQEYLDAGRAQSRNGIPSPNTRCARARFGGGRLCGRSSPDFAHVFGPRRLRTRALTRAR